MNGAELDRRVRAAVARFWSERQGQAKSVKKATAEGRDAVVGGAQMNGFVELVAALVKEAGIPDAAIYRKRSDLVLPGFYRPTKNWDLIVVVDSKLLASVEFKSQVGSFGNNYNNRTEEALGNATDLWRAYQEGAFRESPRPWLGWLMLLEEAPGSTRSVKTKEPFFQVARDFVNASYARRYEELCRRLMRERLYDGACLLLSTRAGGGKGVYREPATDVGFRTFAASLFAHASAYASLR